MKPYTLNEAWSVLKTEMNKFEQYYFDGFPEMIPLSQVSMMYWESGRIITQSCRQTCKQRMTVSNLRQTSLIYQSKIVLYFNLIMRYTSLRD